jgi:hypothetical protein
MGTMINYLKSHPDINGIAGLREGAIFTVLSEIEEVNILGCTTGQELASYMQANPAETGIFIFFSDELIWLLRTGPDATLWVTNNPGEMRTFIEGVSMLDQQKAMMLELMDRVILSLNQQQNN